MLTSIPSVREPELPAEHGLDIGALIRSLKRVNSSYKFLWLLGLLETIPSHLRPLRHKVSMRKVINEMLVAAEQPVRVYKLYLGKHDRMHELLVGLDAAQHSKQLEIPMKPSQAKHPAFERAFKRLVMYVPQQWLVPFLEKYVTMPPSSTKVSQLVLTKANEHFDSPKPPPYKFTAARTGSDLIWHRQWLDYFWRNREIIKGWCLFNFIAYLQNKNPNTPGMVNKIISPDLRSNLARERSWWQKMIATMGSVHCIYSGEILRAEDDDFALDHFVPWSFVGHNQIWNLVPTSPRANSAKKDFLPSAEYLAKFTEIQHAALCAHAKYQGQQGKGWNDMLDAYTVDLRLAKLAPPPSLTALNQAYDQVIPPLISLATSRGFVPNWRFN